MKTPDKINKGLCQCALPRKEMDCSECPYNAEGDCISQLSVDALAYIRQLERERDAAVEQMKRSNCCCTFCKYDSPFDGCTAEPVLDRSCFVWRGAKDINVTTKNGGATDGNH